MGGAVAATGLGYAAPRAEEPRRVLRIAHFTDVHLFPHSVPMANLVRALRHVQELEDRPDLIVQGGDAILDALRQPRDDVKKMWGVWHSVWKQECSLPVYQTIGNHDIFGWDTGQAGLDGKRWALDELGLEKGYYSFNRAGWHFAVLDSNFYLGAPRSYEARLDPEQAEWLARDLASVPSTTPICVISHIPIICFSAFFDGPNELKGDWAVPGKWMHLDARALKDLFRKHPNVKLCLSGHIHLQDQVEYLGVKYLCNGSVSGDVWRGNYQDFAPSYFLVDLYADGSSTHQAVAYQSA